VYNLGISYFLFQFISNVPPPISIYVLQPVLTFVGSGRGHSVLEVVSVMEAVTNRTIPIHLDPRREGDVGICVARPDKAEKELGWKAERSLETCCTDMWRFLERESKGTAVF